MVPHHPAGPDGDTNSSSGGTPGRQGHPGQHWRAEELRRRVNDRMDQQRADARREVGRRIMDEKRHHEREVKRVVAAVRHEAGELTLAITDKIHLKEIFARRTENQWDVEKELRVLGNSMRSHTERGRSKFMSLDNWAGRVERMRRVVREPPGTRQLPMAEVMDNELKELEPKQAACLKCGRRYRLGALKSHESRCRGLNKADAYEAEMKQAAKRAEDEAAAIEKREHARAAAKKQDEDIIAMAMGGGSLGNRGGGSGSRGPGRPESPPSLPSQGSAGPPKAGGPSGPGAVAGLSAAPGVPPSPMAGAEAGMEMGAVVGGEPAVGAPAGPGGAGRRGRRMSKLPGYITGERSQACPFCSVPFPSVELGAHIKTCREKTGPGNKPRLTFSERFGMSQPDLLVPQVPKMFRTTAMDSHSISFAWAPPVFNGGARIFDYIIDYSKCHKRKEGKKIIRTEEKMPSISTSRFCMIDPIAEKGFKLEGLTGSQEYINVFVRARNEKGFSGRSNVIPSISLKSVGPPAPPLLFTYQKSTSSSAQFTWAEPAHNGGGGDVSYEVTYFRDVQIEVKKEIGSRHGSDGGYELRRFVVKIPQGMTLNQV